MECALKVAVDTVVQTGHEISRVCAKVTKLALRGVPLTDEE